MLGERKKKQQWSLCEKKRWQENTELYKKDPHDPDNHDGVNTHTEPDNLRVQSQLGLRKHHYKQS